jgi:hypothetical protein
MVGILLDFLNSRVYNRVTNNNGGPMLLVIEIIIWLLVIMLCFIVMAGEYQFSMLVVQRQVILNKI